MASVSPICNGSCTDLSIAITGGWSGASPYDIVYTDGTSNFTITDYVSNTSIHVCPTTTTTYSLVSITDNFGCTAAFNVNTTVVVWPRPTATLSGTQTICRGQSADLTVTITNGDPGAWTGTINPGGIPFSGSTNPIIVTVNPTTSTTYTLATLVGRCTALESDLTGTATVTVNDLTLDAKVFLEGPWDGSISGMTTELNYYPTFAYIPTSQPYTGGPYPMNYTGTESVASIPNGDITDWILVELRTGLTTIVDKRAGFLKYNGHIVDLDGTSQLAFPLAFYNQNYQVVIWHRNHIGVMSANDVHFTCTGSYDFTTSQSQAVGTNPMQQLASSPDIFGLKSGDVNTDEYVDALDWNSWFPFNGLLGYFRADMNLDSSADVFDPNTFWMQHNGNSPTFVP